MSTGKLNMELPTNMKENYISASPKNFNGYYDKEILLYKGLYTFNFDIDTEEGKIEVILLDKLDEELAKLSESKSNVTINIEDRGKYTIKFSGKEHTGNIKVKWEEIK